MGTLALPYHSGIAMPMPGYVVGIETCAFGFAVSGVPPLSRLLLLGVMVRY